jgi:photosystem II stability/assembly factor-like uncharacterized protein
MDALGTTWRIDSTSLEPYRPIRKIVFLDSLHGWACGGAGNTCHIVRTFDGGATWTVSLDTVLPLDYPSQYSLRSIAFADSMNGISAGASNLILRTTNGGRSWNRESSVLPQDGDYYYPGIAFPSPALAVVPGTMCMMRFSGPKGRSSVAGGSIEAGPELSIYPVPASGWLHVQPGQRSHIEVLDLLGRVVCREVDMGSGVLDIRGLSSGFYVLRARSGTYLSSRPFVKR